eukprot:364915-Chlamydomonas_euryale.AAC.9
MNWCGRRCRRTQLRSVPCARLLGADMHAVQRLYTHKQPRTLLHGYCSFTTTTTAESISTALPPMKAFPPVLNPNPQHSPPGAGYEPPGGASGTGSAGRYARQQSSDRQGASAVSYIECLWPDSWGSTEHARRPPAVTVAF